MRRLAVSQRRVKFAAALLTVLLLLPTRSAQSTDQASHQSQEFGDTVQVTWVLVPVVVQDRQGGYLTDLTVDDFRLFVDDQRVPIASFEGDDEAPVSLLFLQDLSGSMSNDGRLETGRELLACLRDTLLVPGTTHEISVVGFGNQEVRLRLPFTRNKTLLEADAEQWRARGVTALHDAVGRLPWLLEGMRHHRRAAILVTDGADNASRSTAGEARQRVRDAKVAVYPIDLGLPILGSGPLERGPDGQWQRPAPEDVLVRLAYDSGGRYQRVDGPADVAAVCRRLGDELRHQYVLAFPTSGSRRTGTGTEDREHELLVEVEHRRAGSVRFRQRYQGAPPAPAETPR